MREENLSVYHCFIEALGYIHVGGRRTLVYIIVLLKALGHIHVGGRRTLVYIIVLLKH